MTIIGSVKENLDQEKRISITPETVKKFTNLGFSINIEKSYADHLNINDDDYKMSGANIVSSKKEILEKSDIILKVNNPSADEANLIKNKSILIGQFDVNHIEDVIDILNKKQVSFFSHVR